MKRLTDIIDDIQRIIDSEGDIPVYKFKLMEFSGTSEFKAMFNGEEITYNNWIRLVQTFPNEF